ncbi:VWA domain-containing protein [Micromonospora sp. WMMD1274]|uniref:VWA domain-containing protein n=1 Tax=Micromonospora sp. WMMD1274 TaxID=3404116 RepID=UPI003B92AFCF
MTQPQYGLRRSVFSRTAIGRVPYAVPPPYVMPRWLRRLLLALLALLLLLLCLVSCREARKPESLSGSTLTGARKVAGPVCLEEAVDLSGSMVAYTEQRERAERELFAFAKRELSPTDRLSQAFFASDGRVTLKPSTLQSLSTVPPPPEDLGGGTSLTPAVAGLIAARGSDPADCAARALILITDGLIGDEPGLIDAAIRAGGYTRIYAVAPAGATGAGRGNLSGGLLDSITVYGFHDGGTFGRVASVLGDARPLDVIFGDILADLTGQQLTKSGTDPDDAQ